MKGVNPEQESRLSALPHFVQADAWRNFKPGEQQIILGKGVADALNVPGTDLRLFGKPESFKKRRMGVVVATGADTDEARQRAKLAAGKVKPVVD